MRVFSSIPYGPYANKFWKEHKDQYFNCEWDITDGYVIKKSKYERDIDDYVKAYRSLLECGLTKEEITKEALMIAYQEVLKQKEELNPSKRKK